MRRIRGRRDPVEHGRPSPALAPARAPLRPTILDDVMRLNQKAQAALMEMLRPGEQPHVVIAGASGSAIVGTGERALVLKAGARFGAPFGARSKAFEYESVIGVRLDTSRLAGGRRDRRAGEDRLLPRLLGGPSRQPLEGTQCDPGRCCLTGLPRRGSSGLRGLLEAFRERHPRVPRRHRSARWCRRLRMRDDEPADGRGRVGLAAAGVDRALPALPRRAAPGMAVLPGMRRSRRESATARRS